jgi:hypothetical protein
MFLPHAEFVQQNFLKKSLLSKNKQPALELLHTDFAEFHTRYVFLFNSIEDFLQSFFTQTSGCAVNFFLIDSQLKYRWDDTYSIFLIVNRL